MRVFGGPAALIFVLSLIMPLALSVFPASALPLDLEPASPAPPSSPPAPPKPLKEFSISAPAGEGTLVVNCDPAGAEVYLDGVLAGEAPVRKEHVKAGGHTLTMKKPGYETSADTITIKKDVTLTVWEKMGQAMGEITVDSRPSGAAVVLDGQEAGTTPITLRRVTGGRHKVLIRRDYFEPREFDVELAAGGKKELSAELKRRLLFVGLTGGAGQGGMGPELTGLAMDMRSEMGRLEVIPIGMDELAGKLVSRGLDPASLDFMKRSKTSLDLEDIALLSGVLEQERAELALVALLSGDGARKALTLTLYSISGSTGDRSKIVSEGPQDLRAEFEDYLRKWSAQEKGARASIGARLADSGGGGLEVESVLPGYPASAAGLVPGDRITGVDGASISGKDDLLSRLRGGKEQQLSVIGPAGSRTVKITPTLSPVETPPDSGGYLYNLALVEYAAGDGADALAGLNLGNVYAHMGEYEKAVNAYKSVAAGGKSGICAGTALYRMGQAYEKMTLWTEAADAYKKAVEQYPDATLEDADGPPVAPLARERLKELYSQGMVSERWYL